MNVASPALPRSAVARARVRRARVLAALALLLVAAVTVACSVGAVPVALADVVAGVGGKGPAAPILAVRLPRIVLGVLVGASLGLSGASLQGLFRNPLVDPALLGVSGGAAVGAVGALALAARALPAPWLAHALPLAAFAGALVATALVIRLGRTDGRTSVTALLLSGIAINALAGAVVGLFAFAATDAQLRSLTFWTLGSVGGASWRTIGAALPLFGISLLLLPRHARGLDALALGEAGAGHLGFGVEGLKRSTVFLVALAVGASVASAGIVGFVGMVSPHAVRLLGGPSHRVVLPGSALLGGAVLVLSDATARTAVVPAELPLGVVTSCLGAPLFLALLLRERRRLS